VLTGRARPLLMHDVTTLLPSGTPPASTDPVVATAVETPVAGPPGASLRLAGVLFAVLFVGGLILHFEPGKNPVDRWGFLVFPNVLANSFLRAMSDLGAAPVTGGVAFVAGASVWRRDRRRALACLVGPALAVGLAELLKHIVGRKFQNALCWPSGTTAAVVAVVTGIVLVTRGRGRLVAVILGSAVTIFEVVALVAFRWHYLSDALGGVVLGVACVILVDAVFHRLHRRGGRHRRRSSPVVFTAPVGPGPALRSPPV
jgi:membrane-associated phospholipid phosphatase